MVRQTEAPTRAIAVALLLLSSLPAAALAQTGSGANASVQEPAPPPPRPAAEGVPGAPESLSHQNQVGIRVGAGMPYVFAVKYGTGPLCSDDPSKTFCTRFGSPLLDVELGFGIGESAEVSVLARFGLTDDEAADHPPLIFGLGVRGYGSPHDMVKLFFGGRVILDATSGSQPNWSSVDIGVRGELGLQVDFIRYVGAYLQLGETISFLRGLYFTTDLTGGVQARFP
jgi:hypothetical protein